MNELTELCDLLKLEKSELLTYLLDKCITIKHKYIIYNSNEEKYDNISQVVIDDIKYLIEYTYSINKANDVYGYKINNISYRKI